MSISPSICVIGNLTIDYTKEGTFLGGASLFISKFLGEFGIVPEFVTSSTNEVVSHAKQLIRLQWHVTSSDTATIFSHSSGLQGQRVQILKSRGCKIGVGNFLAELSLSQLVYLVPVFDELSVDLIDHFMETSVVVCGIQGLLRSADEYGRVTPLLNYELINRLPRDWPLILSDEDVTEVNVLSALISQFHNVVVTRGRHGARLFQNGVAYDIPTVAIQDLDDSTGAGDIFTGGFGLEFQRGSSLIRAVEVGNQAAHAFLSRPLRERRISFTKKQHVTIEFNVRLHRNSPVH